MSLRRRFPSPTVLALAVGCVLLPMAAAAATQPAVAAHTANTMAGSAAASTDFSANTLSKHKVKQMSAVTVTAATLSLHHVPATTPLKVTQPTSVINRDYILNNTSPTATYADIIAITPSVSDREPNGAGLTESRDMSIRGFKDGEFNLTMDGIPVGDPNDFTHHSTDYFMSQDLGSINVDRGPGNASTVGFATFGGTVGMNTRAPDAEAVGHVYGSYGSYATRLLGGSFDTGTLHDLGDLRAFVDYRQVKSNGYLTGANFDRHNFFMKATKPLGEHTELTVVAMTNQDSGSNTAIVGATSYPYVAVNNGTAPFTSDLPGQMQQLGSNYGLSSNPNSQAFSGYNGDVINSDFEYVGLHSDLGDVTVDNKLYTYAYYHHGWNGNDPNGGNYDYGSLNGVSGSAGDGTVPAGAGSTNGTIYGSNNVPGQKMYNLYRNWGDMLRFTQDFGPGELRYGLWVNKQLYHRYKAEIDFTNGGAYNASSALAATDRRIDGTFLTVQPYLEYAWHVTDALTVTPGLKYVYFRRHDVAPVQQKVGAAQDYQQSWRTLLPAIDLHYRIQSGWTAYLQAAKGYLAPNENLFYVPNPLVSDQKVKPQSTTNYQLGTVWQSDRLSLSADVYAINFTNQVTKHKIGGVTIFSNLGGTKYRGAEIEASYLVGGGFSLYGNASDNKATQNSNGLQLAMVPRYTGAAGVIYHQGAWNASLIAKYTGADAGDIGQDANGNAIGIYRFHPFTMTSLAVNYTLPKAALLPRGTKLSLQVHNLTDNRTLDDLGGYTGNGVPLFFTQAGRSVMFGFDIPVR
ncbi:TonB-dependent receptor [Dyella sp. A6]|uniref:TonB-dependent receptor n=1 Tax=Dyella aluminiiresistens TaxID=3069105 RepID=UPI002E7697DC|nr:TonB-dependent receptor [Dyella sp. A6]